MENSIRKPFSFTSRDLKWIALVTMILDHMGAALIEAGIFHYDTALMETLPNASFWLLCDIVLRMIGRVSFPLFAFLLVEGFLHTRNKKRYAIQLFLFACISEIPFDLAFEEFQYQNIFFTLWISFCVMWCCENKKENRWIQGVILVIGCIFVWWMHSDHGVLGVLLILTFYFFHEDIKKRNVCAGAILLYETWAMLGVGLLSLYLLSFYNGMAGNRRHKYFFYLSYPIHLCVLIIVRAIFLTS